MITPYEIENKEFSKGVRGYNVEEVDEFLDEIIATIENLQKSNTVYQLKIAQLEEEITNTKSIDHSTNEILNSAKNLVADIASGAEKRADSIIQSAIVEADLTKKRAIQESQRYIDEAETLRNRLEKLKKEYKQYLVREINRMDLDQEDFINEIDKYFVNTNDETFKGEISKQTSEKIQVAQDNLVNTRHK